MSSNPTGLAPLSEEEAERPEPGESPEDQPCRQRRLGLPASAAAGTSARALRRGHPRRRTAEIKIQTLPGPASPCETCARFSSHRRRLKCHLLLGAGGGFLTSSSV